MPDFIPAPAADVAPVGADDYSEVRMERDEKLRMANTAFEIAGKSIERNTLALERTQNDLVKLAEKIPKIQENIAYWTKIQKKWQEIIASI